MAARYVEVNREKFCQALETKGFVIDPDAHGELVYLFQHKIDKTMFVKIYTSLPIKAGDARGRGEDAIRIFLIFKNDKTGKSGCLFKAPRVYRVGTEQEVIDRTIQRARDAYQHGTDRIKNLKG